MSKIDATPEQIVEAIKQEECPDCGGSGREYMTDMSGCESEDIGECELCDGHGVIITMTSINNALSTLPTIDEKIIEPITEVKCQKCGITKPTSVIWCTNPLTGQCEYRGDIITSSNTIPIEPLDEREVLIQFCNWIYNDSRSYYHIQEPLIDRYLATKSNGETKGK